jgi:hypothetical protein
VLLAVLLLLSGQQHRFFYCSKSAFTISPESFNHGEHGENRPSQAVLTINRRLGEGMSFRQLLSAVAILIMMACISWTAEAQAVTPYRALAMGILTDRLSVKQLQRWRRIERIVFAVDAEGRVLHPVLRGLWKWVDASGHAVYIEIRETSNPVGSAAGNFLIERFDPTGQRHIAVIRLNITTIDQAYVGPDVRRPNGLIPFEGLGKEERYAEVLGHELAHAEDILSNRERARLVEEYIEQTNELILSRHETNVNGYLLGEEMRQRLLTRDCLLHGLEAYAEDVEILVWRELLAGQPARQPRTNGTGHD